MLIIAGGQASQPLQTPEVTFISEDTSTPTFLVWYFAFARRGILRRKWNPTSPLHASTISECLGIEQKADCLTEPRFCDERRSVSFRRRKLGWLRLCFASLCFARIGLNRESRRRHRPKFASTLAYSSSVGCLLVSLIASAADAIHQRGSYRYGCRQSF